jgi:hypothetical protein
MMLLPVPISSRLTEHAIRRLEQVTTVSAEPLPAALRSGATGRDRAS